MKRNDVYVDLNGDALALGELDAEERKLLARLRRRAKANPDWDHFDNYWTVAIPDFYEARGLVRKAVPRTLLWQIAQDLSSRLGIAAGHVQPPGPLDELDEFILSQFGSPRDFCRATGISHAALDGYLAGRADLSLLTLAEGLQRIGYRLRILPGTPVEPAQTANGKRSPRRAQSA
jgi:hypothetical protein